MIPIKPLLIGKVGGSSGGGAPPPSGGGGGGPTVDIYDAAVSRSVIDPANATTSYSLASDGTGTLTGTPTTSWTWLLTGLNSDCQVYTSVLSGTTPTGTLNSWVTLGTTRTWALSQTVVGSVTCTIRVKIRRAVDSVVIDTADITLTSTVVDSGGTA